MLFGNRTSRLKRHLKKLNALAGADNAFLFPLNESNMANGAIAYDYSPNRFQGIYNDVVRVPGFGDGNYCPDFNATSSYVDVFSAGMAAALNPLEFSVMCWVSVRDWALNDGGTALVLRVDANNGVVLQRLAVADRLTISYLAGGVEVGNQTDILTTTDKLHFAMTVSKSNDKLNTYLNGAILGTPDLGGLGVWAGTVATNFCNVGVRRISAYLNGFDGRVGLCHWVNRVYTAAEIEYASQI